MFLCLIVEHVSVAVVLVHSHRVLVAVLAQDMGPGAEGRQGQAQQRPHFQRLKRDPGVSYRRENFIIDWCEIGQHPICQAQKDGCVHSKK